MKQIFTNHCVSCEDSRILSFFTREVVTNMTFSMTDQRLKKQIYKVRQRP